MNIVKITNEPCSFLSVSPVWPENVGIYEIFDWIYNRLKFDLSLLTPREVCIALAHQQIIELCLKKNIPLFVLESDCNIDATQIEEICCFLENERFCHFGYVEFDNYVGPIKIKAEQRELKKYHLRNNGEVFGAFAYYLTPDLAVRLLEKYRKKCFRADEWFYLLDDKQISWVPLIKHPEQRGDANTERREKGFALKSDLLPALARRLWPKKS